MYAAAQNHHCSNITDSSLFIPPNFALNKTLLHNIEGSFTFLTKLKLYSIATDLDNRNSLLEAHTYKYMATSRIIQLSVVCCS